MENPLFKKTQTPNFSDPAIQKAFIEEAKTDFELFQKELIVNHSEQLLLEKRILMMKEFLNDLPASDPQYHVLRTQIEMDAIELSELKFRSLSIEDQINNT